MSAVRVARALHRPRHDRQVRRLLPRPRRRLPRRRPAPARLTLGVPDQPRRAEGGRRRYAARRYNDLDARSKRSASAPPARSPPSSWSRSPATWASSPPATGFLGRAARAVHDATARCSIFDEVITGFRVAAGGAQGALRHRARPDLPRQDHRRRPAGRRLRRPRRHHGAGRAGRPGLPGRHAVRQPAGDDGGRCGR